MNKVKVGEVRRREVVTRQTEAEKHIALCRLLLFDVDSSCSSESMKEAVDAGSDDVADQLRSNNGNTSESSVDSKSSRLRYARPGCVNQADIVALIRVMRQHARISLFTIHYPHKVIV